MRIPTDLREELYELELSGYFNALAPSAKHSIYIKLDIKILLGLQAQCLR